MTADRNKGKPALGRGLSALLPERKGGASVPPPPPPPPPRAADSGRPIEVELTRLDVNSYQPRTDFVEEQLEDLTRSIRSTGILQPIVVAKSGDRFTIIAGERRFRAAQRAGLAKVPVVLHDAETPRDFLELALVENLQRSDLNPMEEAEAYRKLRDEFAMTQEEIASRVGKDRSSVGNVLRLLRLPLEVQTHLRAGRISFGHAKAILGLEKDSDRLRLAEEVVEKRLSVREAENWVAARPDLSPEGAERQKKEAAQKDVHTREAEEKLSAHLGTHVEIVRRRKGGELRLRFGSEDELIRLYDQIIAAERR